MKPLTLFFLTASIFVIHPAIAQPVYPTGQQSGNNPAYSQVNPGENQPAGQYQQPGYITPNGQPQPQQNLQGTSPDLEQARQMNRLLMEQNLARLQAIPLPARPQDPRNRTGAKGFMIRFAAGSASGGNQEIDERMKVEWDNYHKAVDSIQRRREQALQELRQLNNSAYTNESTLTQTQRLNQVPLSQPQNQGQYPALQNQMPPTQGTPESILVNEILKIRTPPSDATIKLLMRWVVEEYAPGPGRDIVIAKFFHESAGLIDLSKAREWAKPNKKTISIEHILQNAKSLK